VDSDYELVDGILPMAQIKLSLDDYKVTEEIRLETLDYMIGIIGGVYAAVWASFGFCLKGFQSF
jgi:hypothetical protein